MNLVNGDTLVDTHVAVSLGLEELDVGALHLYSSCIDHHIGVHVESAAADTGGHHFRSLDVHLATLHVGLNHPLDFRSSVEALVLSLVDDDRVIAVHGCDGVDVSLFVGLNVLLDESFVDRVEFVGHLRFFSFCKQWV
ncbi:hypothetical protein PFISCL1PPCAC_17895 [Pristionchus fissidentatus]|uniref:Ribosomal protein n=1 Tax=Pristionchus fissidentatus TaxID=1538716 RepID=A0AAV5W4Y4_9BILA|nr:hypothetical protein PFISCL1PPCAC_17895 [Pristionchus fissidentatus]